MPRVRKGNRELTIEEHRLDAFLSQGYDQVDPETGKILKKGEPVTLTDFKIKCAKLTKELDSKNIELESKNKELDSKNIELESKNKELENKDKEIKELKTKISKLNKNKSNSGSEKTTN